MNGLLQNIFRIRKFYELFSLWNFLIDIFVHFLRLAKKVSKPWDDDRKNLTLTKRRGKYIDKRQNKKMTEMFRFISNNHQCEIERLIYIFHLWRSARSCEKQPTYSNNNLTKTWEARERERKKLWRWLLVGTTTFFLFDYKKVMFG